MGLFGWCGQWAGCRDPQEALRVARSARRELQAHGAVGSPPCGLDSISQHCTEHTHTLTHTPKHPCSILPKAKNQAASAKWLYLEDKWVIFLCLFVNAYKLKEICQMNCFNQLFFNLTHGRTIPGFWEYWPRLTRMCFSATPYINRGPHLKQYMGR